MNYDTCYITEKKRKENSRLDQLMQLVRIVADGDLISKPERDELVKNGFFVRSNGFNIITPDGIDFLSKSKILMS